MVAGRGKLLGREPERARLDETMAALRAGESRVLVIRGAPGIGKTELLAYAGSAATDVRVLRSTGVESEMELAFAALHQLCAPLLDRRSNIPAPQRAALETVFGLREGVRPDAFLVGLAVLSLLCDASAEGPLLCVVEDAHWLDRPSARVLGFVGRRLLAESIVLLFGTRETGPDLRGLPELEVGGLSEADAQTLLDSALRTQVDPRIRERILAEARGNPLALLELPRDLTVTGIGPPDIDPLPGRIEESFLHRIRDMSGPARLLLLVAAAEPVGDPDLVRAAADRLGVELGGEVVEGTDGLLTVDDRVTFRHPLGRSAVYRAAEPRDRRAVHRALAEVTDRSADPDRRAWHRAMASGAPDESIAAELEQSAGRAQARGGLAAAAAFLQRSVALTADAGRRTDRALAAAEMSLRAGDVEEGQRLLSAAATRPLDDVQLGRATALRGQVAFATGDGRGAVIPLLEAGALVAAADPQRAREVYLDAYGIVALVADHELVTTWARAVRALPPPERRGPLSLLLDGLALIGTDGPAAAAATLEEAAAGVAGLPAEDVTRWGWAVASGCSAVWDNERCLTVIRRHVQIMRDAGASGELLLHLHQLSSALCDLGDLGGAAEVVAEAEAHATATGQRHPPFAQLRLAGLRGREAEAVPLIEATVRNSAAAGLGAGVVGACWTATVLHNGHGRYPEALRFAREAAPFRDPWLTTWMLPEIVEAATRAGEPGIARDALDRLVAATRPFRTDFARGVEARARALVADGTEAEDRYREAVERLGRTRLRPDLARAHLLYGEWLRRDRRRADARTQLRTAYGMFAAIGMEAFAERARRELLATGETVRKRTAEAAAGVELTAQEQQIALLVRDGFSNPEVGARLFLSPRTVEWHLRKIFGKLGISSRRQLRAALPVSE